MSEIISLVAHLQAKPGKEQELVDTLLSLVGRRSRKQAVSTTIFTAAMKIPAVSCFTKIGIRKRIWTIISPSLIWYRS